MLPKHTIESANRALKDKGLDYLTVIFLDEENKLVTVKDEVYGEYKIDYKSLAPKSLVPPHKRRKHNEKLDKLTKKYVNNTINDMTIVGIFYGPDRGYKNRSFYLEYTNQCGHSGIATYASLTKHKKTFKCPSCSHITHGVRTKENGVLKKRTPTYLYWQSHKEEFPERYQEFTYFLNAVGEKPHKKSSIRFINEKPVWIIDSLTEDSELDLIASAIRQAFRHSVIYKTAVLAARVETNDGVRYQCAVCKNFVKYEDIQVDHIDPVKPLDGSSLDKNTLIDRIWTDKIQILDKDCHTKKSTVENKLRREAKKGTKDAKPKGIKRSRKARSKRNSSRSTKSRTVRST